MNSFREDGGSTSSDSDGEILKRFEISVSRSHTFRTQTPDRRERPRLGLGPSVNQEQETVGSDLSDCEGGPSKQTRFPKGSIWDMGTLRLVNL